MKKRLVPILLIFALVVSICGCAGTNGGSRTVANLEDYCIVYPEDAVALEQQSALYLSGYILEKTGYTLTVTDDSTKEADYEILIGDTNRSKSKAAAKLEYAEDELLIKADGKKIVLYGRDLMIAGAAGQFANQYVNDGGELEVPADGQPVQYQTADAKNVILMIGDGMGDAHISLAQSKGMEVFAAHLLPNHGYLKTDSLSGTTESAAAGTALSSGYKTRNGYIGMDGDGKARPNIREVAYELGYKTAIVTTDAIHGATPAAFAAHVDSRDKTDEIIAQMSQLLENGQLDYLVGTSDNPMDYAVVEALKEVSADSEGFFVMIEEAYIDKRAHEKNLEKVSSCVKRFNDSVAYVIAFTMAHPGTVLIVTADHETGGIYQNDEGDFIFGCGDHTPADVPIYAFGAGTENFHKNTLDNTEVAIFMGKIFGVENLAEKR